MGISALALLRVVESADRVGDLDGWSQAFREGLMRSTGALGCQLLRVRDGGTSLEALGREDACAREVIASGHASLDEAQRRRIYQRGATVVCLADLYDDAHPAPAPLAAALRAAQVEDVFGLVASPGVSVGLFMPCAQPMELRRRQLLLSLAHHVGASVALRAALHQESLTDDELPSRLRGALGELDRRRGWARRHGDADDAASALAFLAALSSEGFAVVHDTRTGRRHRLIAVRVKDPAATAMRTLDAGERNVLEGLTRGQSLQEIAFDLGVAEATVSGRISRIRAKLGIDPRSELVRAARGRVGS
ncbi:MAG: helix-turn-helix transcriptional regulator [Myxococcota bacterium]|nr:helix-turn-helix transcriptional regulator [Myxococcota bacterium]